MLRRAIFIFACASNVVASVAAAQSPANPIPAAPVTVAGVDVVASDPPAIIGTYPAAGAQVSPGVLVIKIVFDQAMAPDAWSYAKTATADYPPCLSTPRLLPDRKTFVLLCTAGAGRQYGVDINGEADKAFVNVSRRRTAPFELRFSTSSDEPVRSLKAAMTKAGLGDLDMPVESLGAFVRPAPGPLRP